MLTPVIAYLWPPAQASTTTNLKVQVGTVDEFPLGSGKVVSMASKPVIVVNSQVGGLRAFSAVRTHLG